MNRQAVQTSVFRSALHSTIADLSTRELHKFSNLLAQYDSGIETISTEIFEKLSAHDQSTFLQWFLFRWGGVSILQAADVAAYEANVEKFTKEPKTDIQLNGRTYKKVNCGSQGYDFDLVQYDWVCGVHDIFYNQYEHGSVQCARGDTIIDGGAFIGDTAALFNYKTAGDCAIHSFELLDENIELYEFNTQNNGMSRDRYVINKLALSNLSDETLNIDQNSQQSAARINSNHQSGESISTITIDDYVERRGLEKVDFIKCDIEGAERAALEGARNTIQRFAPKLAICIYHLWDDPLVIPQLVNSMRPDYRFYFKWVHLHRGWEAVLLADARKLAPIENSTQAVSVRDFSLRSEQAQEIIAKLASEFGTAARENEILRRRYIEGGFLKKTFIYDLYLKIKGREH